MALTSRDPNPLDAPPEGLVRHVKEIKLQLPLRTHVSLHSLKLIKNQSIRDSVVAALDRFFQEHPLEPIGAPTPNDAQV